MSRFELSIASDVSPAYVSHVENGRIKRPSAEALAKLAGGLGLSGVDELLAGPPEEADGDSAA